MVHGEVPADLNRKEKKMPKEMKIKKINLWSLWGVWRKFKKAKADNSPGGKKVTVDEVLEIVLAILDVFDLKVTHSSKGKQTDIQINWGENFK